MRNLRGTIALVLLVAPVGCDFYFGQHGDDDCEYLAGAPSDVKIGQSDGLRNPETGQCEQIGYPSDPCGGYVRDETDPAGPLAPDTSDGVEVSQPEPAWAACYDACTDLDETTCRAADGCRAIYIDPCIDRDCLALPWFTGCWGTSPVGPIRGGGCSGLDSFTCSEHDDCSAVHHPVECGPDGDCDARTPGNFGYCQDEEAPPPPPPPPPVDCATVTSERECIEASNCQPLYEGSECRCDASGCGCGVWTYVSCHAR